MSVFEISREPVRKLNRKGSLYVSLSATAVIGETTCIVTGSIPRLSSETAIDFILQIETENEMDMFQPSALVSNLTNDGYTFKAGGQTRRSLHSTY